MLIHLFARDTTYAKICKILIQMFILQKKVYQAYKLSDIKTTIFINSIKTINHYIANQHNSY